MNARNGGQTVAQVRAEPRGGLFSIEFAIANYDRTRHLIDGRIKPDGIALNIKTS